MTATDYQNRNRQINQEIEALKESATAYDYAATKGDVGAKAWRNDKDSCNQVLKSKREECKAENEKRELHAKGHDQRAAEARAAAKHIREIQIPLLEEEFEINLQEITRLGQTSADVSKTLAGQGLTTSGANRKAELEAGATADAIREASKAAAASQKGKAYLFIGGGVMVLVIVAVVAYQKLKS